MFYCPNIQIFRVERKRGVREGVWRRREEQLRERLVIWWKEVEFRQRRREMERQYERLQIVLQLVS